MRDTEKNIVKLLFGFAYSVHFKERKIFLKIATKIGIVDKF